MNFQLCRFHDCIYVTLILLLWDLSSLCVVDDLWPYNYIWLYIYIYIYNRNMGLQVSKKSIFQLISAYGRFQGNFFIIRVYRFVKSYMTSDSCCAWCFIIRYFFPRCNSWLMVVWNEHKICSKSELKRSWVLDLTLLVLECQVLVSRSLLFFSVLFLLYLCQY